MIYNAQRTYTAFVGGDWNLWKEFIYRKWCGTTHSMVFNVMCVIVSLTLFWGLYHVALMINNFHYEGHIMTLSAQVHLLKFGHEYDFNSEQCYEVFARVTWRSTSRLKCTPTTPNISMLNNIIMLHIKTQNYYPKYSKIQPYMLQC